MLKDAEKEIRGDNKLSTTTTDIDSLPRTCHLQVRQVDSCESTASSVSQLGGLPRDGATYHRRFADCFFDTLPLVVHPVIILRLLCHKMFGGMLRRRKTSALQIAAAASSSPDRNSLTPPPVIETEQCPPAWMTTESTAAASRPHRKSNVHVHITVPGGAAASTVAAQLDDEFRVHRRRTRRAGSMDKHLLRVGSAKRRRSVQAVMGLVMKTIGDSIQQPLTVDEGAAALTAAEEAPSVDDRRWRVFFRLPSLRKRSQSQGFIASSTRLDASTDSVAGLHRSSTTSIAGTGTGRPDESEIKDFQKTLINLPIYEVDTAGGRQDAGGLSMSRFSSVPDQLEYLHVLSAQFIDKGREQKETVSTPEGGRKNDRDLRDADTDTDTVAALPSDSRGCRSDAGSSGGSLRRRRGLTSSSSASSRESATAGGTVGGSGRRTKLRSDSSTSRNAASSSLTPLPSEAIIFHFAAATPCESPISLADQPLMTFSDVPAVNKHERIAATLSDDDLSRQPQMTCDSAPRIPPPLPASLSDSPTSLALRPNNLWNGQNASPSVQSDQSAMSLLSPMSSFKRSDHPAAPPHSPNLSLILPATPGCSEVPAPVGHRAVMTIVESWVDACSGVDLDATPLVKKEMKDFLGKMASLGVEYRAWSHRIRDKLKLEVSRALVE